MEKRSGRVLTLFDAMILIGAAAIGLGVYVQLCRGLFPTWLFWLSQSDYTTIGRWDFFTWTTMLSRWVSLLIPFATSWTCALLLLRERPPRPSWRRTWRQPGMSACLAALVGFFWATAGFLAAGVHYNRVGRPFNPALWWQQYIGGEIYQYIGLAVAATWTVQFFAGWPRPYDAIDRLGRLVGATWIVIGLGCWMFRQYFGDF